MSNCVFNYNLYFNYGSTYILRIIRGYRIASKHTFKVISGIMSSTNRRSEEQSRFQGYMICFCR